ncbi:MAG: transglycosylase SLT domain-containing protein [Pyrinomonadaceae bacterium]
MSIKIIAFLTFSILSLAVFTIGCSAQQTEEQALQSLRSMARDGKTPTEDQVALIESRFSGKRAGTLAKLLHAKIKYDNRDYAGAAALLNADEVFRSKTKVADHALWLRGSALQQMGNHGEAIAVFQKLLTAYPDSIRATKARLAIADSAIQSTQWGTLSEVLAPLIDVNDPDALLRMGKAAEAKGAQADAIAYYRRAYFSGASTGTAKEAEAKLNLLNQPLTPQSLDEARSRADGLYAAKNYAAAEKAYTDMLNGFPTSISSSVQLRRLTVFANLRKASEAQSAFNSIPVSAREKEEAYYQLAIAYVRARQWAQARSTVDEMRSKYPNGKLTPKAWVDAGMAARDAKSKADEQYFLRTAVTAFPNAVEVAGAQFELAWMEHDSGNFASSSQMLTEHLARYAQKDTTNRGKAGYWAARDSERAGKITEACSLYNGVMYRYAANWYGYLAQQRLDAMRGQGNCGAANTPAVGSLTARAVAAMRTITVAPETATSPELARAEKGDELGTVGLYDWAIDEFDAARRSAPTSPKLNLALARLYRFKGDNVGAFLALAKSYPDYSQMFPEEMGREEWEIFYPLTNWNDIKNWSAQRNLDRYQIAGFIRQESVFNPRAKSGANAYGLMQLLLPTARSVARKYGSSVSVNSPEDLYYAPTNIELGTAYIRDQFDKFGRVEYVAVAYNAGPNRVPQWRATLPGEIDEFVEQIPFRETKAYVQGIIRNSAQYRRLYDDNGNFKPNVGSRPLRGEIDSKAKEQVSAEFPDVIVSSIHDVE